MKLAVVAFIFFLVANVFSGVDEDKKTGECSTAKEPPENKVTKKRVTFYIGDEPILPRNDTVKTGLSRLIIPDPIASNKSNTPSSNSPDSPDSPTIEKWTIFKKPLCQALRDLKNVLPPQCLNNQHEGKDSHESNSRDNEEPASLSVIKCAIDILNKGKSEYYNPKNITPYR